MIINSFIFILLITFNSGALELKSRAIYLGDALRPSTKLSTCWINPQDDRIINSESSLKIIEDIVTKEYLRAGIEVSGWTPCNGTENSREFVKILISDKQPRVSTIGCLQDAPWCVRFNLQFNTWPGLDSICTTYSWENAWACNCHQEEFAKACVQNYALHEFGHVIGLAHEADHSLSLCDDKTGTVGAVEMYPYDPLSIMDYCNNKMQILDRLTPSLSDMDVQTVLKLYTPPPLFVGAQ